MSRWPCDRCFVHLKIKNQLWNTFYTESPRNITINMVIILILLIYEIKVEKYTKIFTIAIKNWHCIKQLAVEYSCLAWRSLWWFHAVPKASGRWQHTTEVGYICSIGREARKSAVGHICPTGPATINKHATTQKLLQAVFSTVCAKAIYKTRTKSES
jgi:hypothetical protein